MRPNLVRTHLTNASVVNLMDDARLRDLQCVGRLDQELDLALLALHRALFSGGLLQPLDLL